MPVFQLTDKIVFPQPRLAREDGLLAIGGDLTRKRLLLAYRLGIFPWFSDNEPVLWWSPDPRLVLYPNEFRTPKSLQKLINKKIFKLTMDQAFDQVITACARVRIKKNEGTWIVKDMIRAYCRLHESGFAHSVEVWQDNQLIGGLYGVSLGRCFFGESMFTRINNASKVAFAALVKHLYDLSFDMIDCQLPSAHLMRFGAREIPRTEFLKQLKASLETPTMMGPWSFRSEFSHAI